MSIYQLLSILALIFSLGGNILINFKKRMGFIVWIVSNTIWIAVNFISVQINWSQIIMFTVYIGLSIHGYINWKSK